MLMLLYNLLLWLTIQTVLARPDRRPMQQDGESNKVSGNGFVGISKKAAYQFLTHEWLYRERRSHGFDSWSSWRWESCSTTCGSGTRIRRRHIHYSECECTNSYVTEAITEPCSQQACPVDGNWSVWSLFGPCPVTCGGGTSTRKRTCSNPPPSNGGQGCLGHDTETQACGTTSCPVDGNWSEWTPFEHCTLSCAGGTRTKTRFCTDPAPKFGGDDCVGNDTFTEICNNFNCPVDGGWSLWGLYGPCSVTCGNGDQSRSRSCTNPVPAYGGQTCVGNSTESRTCNESMCRDPRDQVGCHCTCVNDNVTIEQKIQLIVSRLKLNKSELKTSKRKLISVPDTRESAAVVGNIGVAFLAALGLLFLCMDLDVVARHICKRNENRAHMDQQSRA